MAAALYWEDLVSQRFEYRGGTKSLVDQLLAAGWSGHSGLELTFLSHVAGFSLAPDSHVQNLPGAVHELQTLNGIGFRPEAVTVVLLDAIKA